MINARSKKSTQRGSMLIEALIAILLFSMGILGLLGLQAAAMKNTAEARYRIEAAFLANQIIGQMWADNPGNLASYAHNPTTNAGVCNFGGAASGNANVTAWLGNASTPGTVAGSLPGATSALQQITVAAGNVVTVTLCWQHPREAVAHTHLTTTQISN